jgi:SRSO17 transposase
MDELSVSEDMTLVGVLFEDFNAFRGRFASLFARSEAREQAGKYLRALLGPVERRNGWQLAEAMGDTSPKSTQRLLREASWDANAAREIVQDIAVEQIGEPEAIGVIDETGFVKQGRESVGVARQYTGTAGKITNCQVGVFVGYTSSKGSVLIDRELYLPKNWCQDQKRLARAKVPTGVRFYTKPTLAAKMLGRAWKRGVPMRWVVGDEVYGNDPKLRDFVANQGRRFVLSIPCSTQVWTERPSLEPSPRGRRDRKTSGRMRLVKGSPASRRVDQRVAAWKPARWHRLITQYGEKGPIEHDWACMRVIESRNKLPGEERCLLVRRSITDPSEMKYYFSNADADTPLATLAYVASRRYTIEQCFEEAKDDTGMDHYEVRHWQGWYRHITLCMMALEWLVLLRVKANEAMAKAWEEFTNISAGPLEITCRERGPAICAETVDKNLEPRTDRPPELPASVQSVDTVSADSIHEEPRGEPEPMPQQVQALDMAGPSTPVSDKTLQPPVRPGPKKDSRVPSTPFCLVRSVHLPLGRSRKSDACC